MNSKMRCIFLSLNIVTVFSCSNPVNNPTINISSSTFANTLSIVSVNPDSAIIDSSNVEFDVKISYSLTSSDSGAISCHIINADTFRMASEHFIANVPKGSGEYSFKYLTQAIQMGNNMVLYVDICPLPHGSSWGVYASSTKSISFK
jgi:hypothetical protein